MAKFVKGDVVVIPFPFSDLSQAKRRPALVVTDLIGDDLILCQITSQNISDTHAISLTDGDFQSGSLKRKSNIRPNRIFTADANIILYKIGHVENDKLDEVINKITQIIHT
ncbi:MAG: type II toxin-antitoxin system PemK/MazF family toxin [Candidatus Lokiarchaeota archaeon]|nr:type II toxin-antitoxin system PemK/MazF family toxin [Candidatus Lokiarchaeota archaeon]